MRQTDLFRQNACRLPYLKPHHCPECPMMDDAILPLLNALPAL
jgi:hypothetical protein